MMMIFAMTITAFAQEVDSQEGGTATITIENASKGETYAVYKLFDATVTGEEPVTETDGTVTYGSIAYTGTIPDSLKDYFAADTAGNISAKYDTINDTMRAALQTWTEEDGVTAAASATSTGSTLIFKNLKYGYYVVTTSLGDTLISVTSTNPTATIVDKNTVAPGKDENTKYKTVDDAEVAVGDTATFTIQFNTVNYVGEEQVTTYTVTDTPTNLSIKTGTLTVKIGDDEYTVTTEDNGVVLTNKKDASKTVNLASGSSIASTGLTLIFSWVDTNGNNIYDNDTKIVITYQAEVLAAAAAGTASNTATIKYNSHEPFGSETPVLTTYSFQLKKVDENDAKLDNAKFNLQVKGVDKDGNDVYSNVKVVEEKNDAGTVTGYHVADSTETATATETIVAGDVTIKGLDIDKDYQLVETEAPAGYNKLTDPVTLTKTTTTTGDVTTTAFDDQKVENSKGSTLPSTGGIGTTIFYVVGGVLVVAAGVLLVTKKRMGE
jgi:LPXTG-motif cell wall-anchored protein